jgi:hypothetical protein
MYPSTDSPRFIPGGSANAAICIVVAIIAFILRIIHIKENAKLERAELDVAAGDTEPERRAVGFRYIV